MPSNCSVCNSVTSDDLLSKRYIDPAHPSKILGPWCPECLPKVRICNYCRDQTVPAEDNPHNYPKVSRLTPKGEWACTDCLATLDLCEYCGAEGTLTEGPDGKKVCNSCRASKYSKCGCCSKETGVDDFVRDLKIRAEKKGLFKKYGEVCKDCFKTEHTRFKTYPSYKCELCGNYHPIEGSRYCKKCRGELSKCETCREPDHELRSKNIEGRVQLTCPSCAKKLKACSSCNTLTFKATKKKGKWECDNCTNGIACKICHKKKTNLIDGACDYCTTKYVNNKCTNCGQTQDFNGRCRTCRYPGTYGYSTKPPIFFNSLPKEEPQVFFGIENEVTFGNKSSISDSHQIELYEKYDPSLLISKSDSSISGYGYEIVTQPMSLKFFNKLDITGMFHPSMVKCSSVGMHVHISRTSFVSDVHIFKVTKFIYDNPSKVDKIVGRSYTGYNSKLGGKASSAVLKMKKMGASGNRGARVNLTNPITVEFRMFAGCTEEREMRRRIEFLHALITWTRECSIQEIKDFDNLINFITSNSKAYPNAAKYYGV